LIRFLRRLRPIELAFLAGALLALLAIPAVAVPPPKGSEADTELQRFTPEERAWLATQHDHAGRWCCQLGDFDFVTIREKGGDMEIKAKHPDMARGIPDGWLTVDPSRRVDLSKQKHIPELTAAWYYQGKIQCVIIGSGF
jgi:hypothetical protein